MGNNLKILAIIFICNLLSSCAVTEKKNIPNSFIYQNEQGYNIAIPLGYKYSEPAPSGKYFYFGYPNNNTLGISSIEFHPISSPCSPSEIGVSKPLFGKNAEGKVMISGKVDFPLDYELKPLVPDCRPYKPVSAVYILCTENNGRRVAICLQQITDNPGLAEQIFKTFRWVKKPT